MVCGNTGCTATVVDLVGRGQNTCARFDNGRVKWYVLFEVYQKRNN